MAYYPQYGLECNPEQNVPRTKTVTLNFKRHEILDDLKQYSFVIGDILDTNDEHARHQIQDIAEDGNIDRVTRVMNLCISECREILFPYTKEDVDIAELRTNTLEAVEEYNIELLVPDNFSTTTVTLLEQLIHEFIVARIMADWMSITNKPETATWLEKADDALAKIRRCKNKRTGRIRRKMHPFP